MLDFRSALLCLTLLGTGPFLETERKIPATSSDGTGIVTLPVRLHDGYLIVIGASIGGLNGLHFIIDTGSSCTVLREDLAKSLDLKSRRSKQTVFGKEHYFKEAHLPSLEIGPLRFENVRIQLAKLDLSKFSKQVHVEGLIGLNILKSVPTEIDYERQNVRFGPIRACQQKLDVYSRLPFIPIPIRLGGQSLHLSLDTGTQQLILYLRRAERKLRIDPTNELLKLRFLNRTGILRKTQFRDVQIGSHVYKELEAFTLDVDPQKFGPDGVLGPRALPLSRLVFDFKKGIVGWD